MVTLTKNKRLGVENRLNSNNRAVCGHLPPCGCLIASKAINSTSCCIRCPFDACVFDESTTGGRYLTDLKAETVGFMRVEGINTQIIADRMNMSIRNVLKLYALFRDSNGI